MAIELDGAGVIVTGAGSGVGRALAREFGRRGARVACCGRRLAAVEETAHLIELEGGSAIAIGIDVTDRDDVERMVRTALDAFGRLDVLFNNAGRFGAVGPVWEVDPDEWWADATTNLLGTFLCCRAALGPMRARDRGVIINMDGGGGASGPNLGGSGYGSSKAAVVRLTEGLARELEADGSAVLAVCMNPGFVRTGLTEALVATPTGRRWQAFVQRLLESDGGHPPEDCALATMHLLEVIGPAINGCTFSVETDFEAVARNAAIVREEGLFRLRLAERPLS